jgi:hypothetical protein
MTKYLNNLDMVLKMVDEYDQKVVFPLLTKTYKELHLERPHTLS